MTANNRRNISQISQLEFDSTATAKRVLTVDASGNPVSGGGDASAANQTTQITEAQTTNTTLISIDSKASTINTSLSSLDTKASTTNTSLGLIDSNTSNSNTILTSIDGKATTTNSSLASIDSKATTTNTSLSSIDSKLDAVADLDVFSIFRNDYSITPVTTAAYVQVIASTSQDIRRMQIFDSSGEELVIAVGAAASEVNKFYVFPGGNGDIDVSIPAGSRLSIRAISADATSGTLLLNILG